MNNILHIWSRLWACVPTSGSARCMRGKMQAMPAPHIRSIQAPLSPGCLRPQAGVPCKPRPVNREKTPPRCVPEAGAGVDENRGLWRNPLLPGADDSAARRTVRQPHPTSCMCAEDRGTAARWRWRALATPSYARRHSLRIRPAAAHCCPLHQRPSPTHDREHACAACRLPTPPSQAYCDKRPSPGRLSSLGSRCVWSLSSRHLAVGGLLSKASRSEVESRSFCSVICRLKTQCEKVFLMIDGNTSTRR